MQTLEPMLEDLMDLSQDEVFVIPDLGFAAIDILNKALNLKMNSTRALVCKLKLVQHPQAQGSKHIRIVASRADQLEFTPDKLGGFARSCWTRCN